MSGAAVIVGAGAAGLATAACLKREGVRFELLEAGTQVAGPWRTHYERLHLHTAKSLSALPHMPFPRAAPKYPPREQVVAYLEDYARKFELQPQFGERVQRVTPAGGEWLVRSEKAERRARDVVIATGFTQAPVRASFDGLDAFAGIVLHSSEYRSGAAFKSQRVLVVGFGNSGGEIAVDLCEHGAKPLLAVRSAVNVIPREFLGIPITAWGIMLGLLPLAVGDAIGRMVARIQFGKLDELGLRPLPYGPMTQIRKRQRIPLLDVGTLARVRRGEIEVLPGLLRFEPHKAFFLDGREREIDAVILATGFRPAVKEIVDAPEAFDENGFPKVSGAEAAKGLWFCGFHVSPTGMLREIAKEARAVARGIAARA